MLSEYEVRLNWDAALDKSYKGEDLSPIIRWAFGYSDLFELYILYRNNKHREKIENLLSDCNFHTECLLLRNHEYKEFEEYLYVNYFC